MCHSVTIKNIRHKSTITFHLHGIILVNYIKIFLNTKRVIQFLLALKKRSFTVISGVLSQKNWRNSWTIGEHDAAFVARSLRRWHVGWLKYYVLSLSYHGSFYISIAFRHHIWRIVNVDVGFSCFDLFVNNYTLLFSYRFLIVFIARS